MSFVPRCSGARIAIKWSLCLNPGHRHGPLNLTTPPLPPPPFIDSFIWRRRRWTCSCSSTILFTGDASSYGGGSMDKSSNAGYNFSTSARTNGSIFCTTFGISCTGTSTITTVAASLSTAGDYPGDGGNVARGESCWILPGTAWRG